METKNRIKLDENNKLIVDAICETDGTNHNLKIEGDYTVSADDVRKLLAVLNDKHIVRTTHRLSKHAWSGGLSEIFTTSEEVLKYFDEMIDEWNKGWQKTNDRCVEIVDVIRNLYRLIVDHNEKHHSGIFNKDNKIEIPDNVLATLSKYNL